jgi:septal ring factor EnvC (AmiA/AmiB activator)
MKGICRNLERDRFVKQFQMFNKFLLVGVLLLPIFLSACTGKLGSIQTEDVDTLILQAEKAIKSAREVNAPSLAFEEFEQAETYLENAKDALNEHNGVEAIKFANQAITQARIARRKAVQNTMNAEFNATSLEKDALITELQKNIKTNKNRLTDLENRIQQFVETEKELQQNIRTLENEKRELANTERKHEQKVAELSETLKSIQAQSARSETEIRNYGNKVKDLSRKVDAAESMAKSESRQKRAAVAEAESLKKQLREQANVYTKLLSEAKKAGCGGRTR